MSEWSGPGKNEYSHYLRELTVNTAVLEPPPPLEVEATPTSSPLPALFPHRTFVLIFGVILPLLAITFERLAGIASAIFLDPVPTLTHVLLLLLVPLANFLAWYLIPQGNANQAGLLRLINGFALGLSAVYAALFIPVLPLAIIGTFVLIGLLGLAPLSSFIATINCNRVLRRRFPASPPRIFDWPLGLVVGILLLAGLEVPQAATTVAMHRAVSADRPGQSKALEWLRSFGRDETILRACYFHRGGPSDFLLGILQISAPVSTPDARRLYYRVTGRAFDSVPPPQAATRGLWSAADAFLFEAGSGPAVGAVVRNLSLLSSRMDGSLDADAALAYTEWTLTFQNSSAVQQEARAQIKLPPGGFISRLTLWINGEEREAAFGSRGQVTEAYQAVVRQSRDPVLVTTSGPDQILVRCFPVLPSQEMKVRLGITSPLQLEAANRAVFVLPRLIEKNFETAELHHSVWLESKRPFRPAADLVNETLNLERHALRGAVPDKTLAQHGVIRLDRDPEVTEVWARDPHADQTDMIVQRISNISPRTPDRVVVVLDGSAALAPHVDHIIRSLSRLSEPIVCAGFLATDEITPLADSKWLSARDWHRDLDSSLRAFTFSGGRDNVPALLRAREVASRASNSMVLWIHGPQPAALGDRALLKQHLERRPDGPQIVSVQLESGPNRLIEALDGVPGFRIESLSGNGVEDLARVIGATRSSSGFGFIRLRVGAADFKLDANRRETSSHLARLLAHDEVGGLLASADPSKRSDALRIANAYRIVTPVNGAVVLETAQQYSAAGLNPADTASVPSIPEPETWMLLISALAVLTLVFFRRMRGLRQA